VGREQQLGRLDEAFRRARAGLPGAMLVHGEAGAGKTRLLREFLARARAERATILSGVCVETSAGDLPFVPFRIALRDMVRNRSPEELDALLGPTWRDLRVLLPELVVGPALTDAGSPHVFEVVASVVAAFGNGGPVVLAVDDAQWADQSTLQLLRYLLQSSRPLALLVVVAYRGEELPGDPARRKAFEELSRAADEVVTVDPLDDAQVAELVRGIGAVLSAAAMARLLSRAAGLPFLVEELVAAERDGVTRGIPRRVRDVVRLRLGAVSSDAQLVVALVAVAGRSLRHRVLQHAAELPERAFGVALDEALAANLLLGDTTDRTYGFRHDVAREIVHEDLLTAGRLELHLRLAVALQADLPVDAYAGRLCEVAHHWLQTDAHEDQALRAALLAARASTRAFAHPEALRQYEHVVTLWDRVADPELLVGTGLVTVSQEAAEAAHWAGDTEAALRHVDRAIAADAGNDELESLLHERRALYAWLHSGRLKGQAEEIAHVTTPAVRARMRASHLMQLGRYAESVEPARTAVELARQSGLTHETTRSSIVLGIGVAMADRLDEGAALLYQAIDDALGLENAELIVSSHINLTFVLLAHGQVDEAARIAMRGLESIAQYNIAGSLGALVAVNAAEALTRLGRLVEAEQLIVDTLGVELPPAATSALLLGRAEIEVLTGRFAAAETTLRAVAGLAPLENEQFGQQLRAWEAELQLWDPAGGHSVLLPDLRTCTGSAVLGTEGEDLPLTMRLMWLGVRADVDAVARASAARDDAGHAAAVADGVALAARARRIAGSTTASVTTSGMHQQVIGCLALVTAEEARIAEEPESAAWHHAAAANADDPYLRAYALWRQAGALRVLRRRREAAAALREAYSVAAPLGIRVLVDAITVDGLSLNVHLDTTKSPKPRRGGPHTLTAKESEVLGLLVQGYTNRRIGTALHMTEKTASVHVSRILTKLAVGSRGEAVARAYALGLVPSATGR
jgi:DNA-binding CsgD family transcriptional regulator/tetratricopeptide (TPR) repeat protein